MYRDIEANKYCAAQIQNATKDMDQYNRAWYVNEWVQAHSHFEDGYTPGWAALKNRKAHGVCYDLAYFYELAACYAGVEHFDASPTAVIPGTSLRLTERSIILMYPFLWQRCRIIMN